MEDILILVPAASTFAKSLVDVAKMAFPSAPSWASPALALLIGVASVFLLLVAGGEVVTQQLAARAILAGILGGTGAVAVTELHKASRRAADWPDPLTK